MSKKSRKSNSPSIDEKRILVERALKSSFVNIGAISDEFYGLSQGHFDASLPSSELCDPDSILYVVDDICGELSANGEIVELLNVLTVLYAVKKEIPLYFDSFGSLKVCGETGDETFDMLYNATVATRGPEYNFCDVWKLYRNVAKLNREKFLACYPNFIDAVKNRCTALKDGTVALPKPFIAKTIGDIVKAHGCKSVFNL